MLFTLYIHSACVFPSVFCASDISITDNFERSITLNWGTDHVDVTASDGSSVRINIGENAVSSISYNDTETSTFSYLIQNTAFGTQETQIPHILLTGITHPNQHISVYEYEKNSVSRPDYTTEKLFQLKKRYDVVNGIQKNTINYSYAGNHLSNYSNINSIFVQNHSGNNIWSRNGIDYDKYALISNYHTTVSDGISETTYYFNPNARCNSIEVKENGVLLSVRESLYDCDKLIATRETLSDTSGDAMSYFTVYTYDTLKNIVSVKKFQSGNSIYYEETASYDNPYSLITSSSVNGVVTNYTYSSDNKTLSSVEVREDEVLREKSEYTYLSNGNIKTEKVYILPGSTTVTTTYHYGANDTGIFPTSSVTDSIKDSDGNAKSNITLSATYDTAGRILSETDGNGNTTSYIYDLRGRLIRTNHPDGTYETITYDIANIRTTERNRAGYTLMGQYDENGNLISIKESTGTLLASYTYDIRGRVLTERIYQTATTWRETRYTYDANGNRTSLTYANGTTTTYAYNQANLVTSVLNKKGSTTLSSHSYTYYLDGNIASENENGTSRTYEYDGLGRLTKETKNGTITMYTYDANGNRATMTQNNVTTTYTYDANNRLTAETAAGVATTYTYDNNGNLINAWNGGNPVGAYSYNLFGNQVSYTPDGVLYTYYTYRPDGLRHSIGDKIHIWDSANIVADVDGNDVVVYIRGINLIYADDGSRTYYHFNAHGDVVVLTNTNGSKTKSYSYNAFGVEYNEATLDDNPFRYCGEYYDKETKTIYLRARYYNPAQGRFTQQDGWEFANPNDPLSLNLYTYCWNNPIKYDDSNGHYLATKRMDEQCLNTGGAGGGGALLVAAESIAQLVEKIDQGLATVGNALSNTWNSVVNFCATQVDNIARIAADGKQALKNAIDKFAQDFNNNTTNPPDPNNWNHHDYYMNQAENEKLKRIIEQLYREDAEIGDGGTADMLRYEYKNGLELEHLQKATDRINELHKLVNSNVLSESDLKLAYQLLDDLHNAVKMVKGG